MQEKKDNTFVIKNEKGEEKECEVLFTFDSEETKKSYVVYTTHETDEAGATEVYASVFDPTGKDNSLLPIETEEEWHAIEDILSKIEENGEQE